MMSTSILTHLRRRSRPPSRKAAWLSEEPEKGSSYVDHQPASTFCSGYVVEREVVVRLLRKEVAWTCLRSMTDGWPLALTKLMPRALENIDCGERGLVSWPRFDVDLFFLLFPTD